MAYKITIPPVLEPVSLPEVKLQARVEHDEEDVLLDGYIRAARRAVEEQTGRQLLGATIELYRDGFPLWTLETARGERAAYEIPLPRPPLLAVTSIEYLAAGETDLSNYQTLAATVYRVDAAGDFGRVVLAPAQAWPATLAAVNAVRVTYQAGYGTTVEAVPEDLRLAIRMLAAHFFEERAPVALNLFPHEIPFTVSALIEPYRVLEYA